MRVVYIKKLREERWYIRRTWNELELNVTKRLSLIGKSMCYEWGVNLNTRLRGQMNTMMKVVISFCKHRVQEKK